MCFVLDRSEKCKKNEQELQHNQVYKPQAESPNGEALRPRSGFILVIMVCISVILISCKYSTDITNTYQSLFISCFVQTQTKQSLIKTMQGIWHLYNTHVNWCVYIIYTSHVRHPFTILSVHYSLYYWSKIKIKTEP